MGSGNGVMLTVQSTHATRVDAAPYRHHEKQIVLTIPVLGRSNGGIFPGDDSPRKI